MKKPTIEELIEKLRASGKLDLYYWAEYDQIGVRTLHWINKHTVEVSYNHEKEESPRRLVKSQLVRLLEAWIRDDEVHPNYWMAYGAKLRKLAEIEKLTQGT